MGILTPEYWTGLADYVERDEKIQQLKKWGVIFNPKTISDAQLNEIYVMKSFDEIENAAARWNWMAKGYFEAIDKGRKDSRYTNSRVPEALSTLEDCKRVYFDDYQNIKHIIEAYPFVKYLFIEACTTKYNNEWSLDAEDDLEDIKEKIDQLQKPENKEYFNALYAKIDENKKIFDQQHDWITEKIQFAPCDLKPINLDIMKNDPLLTGIKQKVEDLRYSKVDCDTAAISFIQLNLENLLPILARDNNTRRNYNKWSDVKEAMFERIETQVLNLSSNEEKQECMNFLGLVGQNRQCANISYDQFSEIVEPLQYIKPKSTEIKEGFNKLVKILNLDPKEMKIFAELKEQAIRDACVTVCLAQNEKEKQEEIQRENNQEKQAMGIADLNQIAEDALSHPVPQKHAPYWDKEKIDTLNKLQSMMNNETNKTNKDKFSDTLQKICANMENTTGNLGHINYSSKLAVEAKNMCTALGIPQTQAGKFISVVAQDESGLPITLEKSSADAQKKAVAALPWLKVKKIKPLAKNPIRRDYVSEFSQFKK